MRTAGVPVGSSLSCSSSSCSALAATAGTARASLDSTPRLRREQEILFGQQFGQLNDRLTNIGNGICNLGYEMQGGIGQLGKEVALAQNGTNMAIMQTGNDIQRQMADCCCTTQRGLDAINANIDAKFAALEKSQLEGRIAQLEQANNQLYLREQMCGVVRYPSGYTYSAGNSPFCGCGWRKRQHLTPYSARQAGRQQLLRFLIF